MIFACSQDQGCGVLSLAVRSLSDSAYATSTITDKEGPLLTSKEEVLGNAVWRFLHLREYVDDKHQLTKWGHVLAAVLNETQGQKDLEEPAVIAVELLRLGLLTTSNMFNYTGGPTRGTDKDKGFINLVSRVACLGRLRHHELGYTGPLNRNLLGYHSITTVIRSSLRDLAEVSLTALLLNGDAERDRNDFVDLGLELVTTSYRV